MFDAHTLAIIFIGLMALATLLYAILDGYDLGVGILLPLDKQEHADTMVASIGPFWDANETWLVLAVGLLLIAFPTAHSLVLRELYLPSAVLLIGLILRGVAFDFRAKAAFSHKPSWDKAFKIGSLIASLAQGYMLGRYVVGFNTDAMSYAFAILSAVGVSAAYCFIGATWLVMKTEGELQKKAISWASSTFYIMFAGILAVSAANVIISPEILAKWLVMPNALFVLPFPILAAVFYWHINSALKSLRKGDLTQQNKPFMYAVGTFVVTFAGLGFSYFPYVVPGKMTIWDAVAAPEALNFMLYGAIIVVPTILAYTAYSYRVFWGKVQELRYY